MIQNKSLQLAPKEASRTIGETLPLRQGVVSWRNSIYGHSCGGRGFEMESSKDIYFYSNEYENLRFLRTHRLQGSLLLTWFNFDPNMDK